MPPNDEANASGTGGFNSPTSLGAGFDLRLEGIDTAAASVATLTGNLGKLQTALRGFGMASGNALTNLLRDIKKTADEATRSVSGLTGVGGGGGGGTGPSGWASQATQQASASSRMTGGIAAASTYLTGFSNPLVGAGMGALRFMRDRIGTNRNTAIEAGSQWAMTARQQGASIQDMMGQAGQFPGGIYGTPQDLLGLFGNAPMLGASYAFGGGGARGGRQGVRAAGMFAGIREAQMLNPGASVGQITQDIGGFAANTGAQQQAQMLTGGAFGLIAAGGRQKSISEWAESILKWLMGLRGGSDRGKPFTYGQLMAQYFPGSNIDAWFTANGVPQNMRQYWWTYALEKADKSPDKTTGGAAMNITPADTNVAWQRLRATSELTRTEFNLGSQMTGAYLNKEQANKWFNQMFGAAQTSLIPALAGSKALSWIQFLPDTIEDMLMSGVEGLAGATNKGDVGDVTSGMYSGTGGTGMAGLSPNMRSKLGPMMRANKRLTITSGLRDNAMQSRLKSQGYSRVSGKPSAHTRGDAADLGPPSQYGWIMANAGKYGLKSGKSQGEPWHVGVGDVFDSMGGNPLELFQGALGTIGGGELSSDPSSIASVMAKLMSFLLGKLTGFAENIGGPAPVYNPKLFDQLVAASYGTKIGGIPSSAPTPFVTAPAGPGQPISANPAAPGGSTSSTGAYRGFRAPVTEMAQFASGVEIERGAATARALYAAGFRGTDLINMTSIAYRESHWSPTAWNGTGQDRSGGLLQINQKPWLDKSLTPPFSTEDLFDPYANAQIAYDLFTKKIPGKGGYAPWDFPGDYDWKHKVDFNKGRDAVAAAGVGDVAEGLGQTSFGQMGHAQMIPSLSRGRGLVNFTNTFHISGGGGGPGGGIDTRRTVTLLANQLEDEMNRRLSRAN